MAKIRGDYVNLGREAFKEVGHKEGADTGIPCSWNGLSVALSGSWQAMAFKEGWQAEKDNARRRAAQAVNMAKPTAGETLDAGRQAHAAQVARMATEHRRADRIDRMTRGYIAAALGSSGGTTPEGEELESLEGYEFSDESKSKAWGICAAFYDRYTTDVNAYAGTYKPGNGADPYEHAGHDLWLTSCGHGVGFWDRGLGNLGDRLSKACGFRTDFPEKWVDIGDDGYVRLD